MSKPIFKVVPTNDFDNIPAKQLEAIINTESNKKVYQQMVRKSMHDFALYKNTPARQELQANECTEGGHSV